MGVGRIAAALGGSSVSGVVSACLLAVSPRFLFASLSGMENILLLALWVHMAHAALLRRWRRAVILLSLMPITRPEALVLYPLFAGLYWAAERDRAPRSKDAFLVVMAMAPFGFWLLFCYGVTGHPLPNTFYVKALPFSLDAARLSLVREGLSQHGFAMVEVFWIGVLALLAWIVRARLQFAAKLTVALLFVGGPVLYFLGVVGSRRIFLIGYYYTRWLVPPSLVLTICFCLGMSLMIVAQFDRSLLHVLGFDPAVEAVRKGSQRLTIAGLVLLGLSIPSLTRSFLDLRAHLASDTRVIELLNVNAGKWIERHVPESATVGVLDAGAIGYFGQRRTIDLAGLNSADVVFRRLPGRTILEGLDWLAVFPALMPEQLLRERFVERKRFEIPLEQHTILHNQLQTRKGIYQRRELDDSDSHL
jgi:hypothetical protein